ncbi:hypothetical protein YC2023_021133 [Brassica napus]
MEHSIMCMNIEQIVELFVDDGRVTYHARCCITCDFITTYQTSSAVIQAFETDQFRKRFQHKADSFSRTERYKPKCGYPSSNIAPSLNNPIKRERLSL